ncbi:MAG: diacylglycerol kinase family protein [Pseudomonadota bacterium]
MIAAHSTVGLISNPASGHNRDQFQQIEARIGRCESVHHLITQSEADVEPALHEMAAIGVNVLAINGGDGTAASLLGKLVDGGLFDPLPTIILLPGGTANMTAGDVGVTGSLAKATERFCAWCEGPRDEAEKVEQRALMKVMLEHDGVTHYGMFLGGGAVIQETEYAHAEVHARGLRDDFSLALTTLRTVWGLVRNDPKFSRYVTIQMSLDGDQAVTRDTLILAISTLQRLAFGMRPFFGNEEGRVRLTLFERGCSRFFRTFVSIIRGRPNRNAIPASGYCSHNADTIALQMNGKLNLDGEILMAQGRVDISAIGPLNFLRL